jgi:hypothetical protein
MPGYIAALLFIIAFILRVTSTSTGVVFAPQSLLLVGLALLAMHVAGVGGGWRITPPALTRPKGHPYLPWRRERGEPMRRSGGFCCRSLPTARSQHGQLWSSRGW